MNTNEYNRLIKEAFLESWVGFMALSSYITAVVLGANQIVIGGLAVLSAVLFMNGFAKTELFLTAQGSHWWRTQPSLRWIHHISEEGELAGVFIGIVFLISILLRDSSMHVHLPFAGALTLVGIMSSASLAVKRVIPIMAFVERVFGVQIAVFFGALLSALTGAAASVFVCAYFKGRIIEERKADFAIRFAAALGLGNGLLPFASPPVLIIWAILQEKLHWSVGSLLLFVGIPAVIYAFLITWKIGLLLKSNTTSHVNKKISFGYELPLLVLVVVESIIDYTSIYDISLNIFVGILATVKGKDFHERSSAWVLGLLLIALEIIGTEATEFVDWLSFTLIPDGMPAVLLALILFYITAFISHFADNALASKLVITAAISSPLFALHGDFLATSVVLGALAGGFTLIPANLPNFPIARILNISPGMWSKAAMKIYITILFFFIWIFCSYFVTKLLLVA